MKRKRFIALGAIALVMTAGTGVAFGAVIEASEVANKQQQVTQVTKPAEVIDSPVKEEILVSGQVQVEKPAITAVFKSQAPEVGSVDWMAQEKAEKDKLRSDAEQKQAELEAEIARLEKIATDTENLNKTLALLKNQVGVTRYVFSGSTPNGWDCSGIVRWTYAQLGIDLRHSATAQRLSGEIVAEPKIGDLVSFNFKNSKSAYHIGIYLGPDEMIHSGGKRGDRTEIISIAGWAKDNWGSEIVYTRIIETNN
jgi:cell wall-associated NlpC family hydrolase